MKRLILLTATLLYLVPASAQINFTSGLKAYLPCNNEYFNAQGNSDYHYEYYNASFGADSAGIALNSALFNGSTRVNVYTKMINTDASEFSVEFWFNTISTAQQVFYWEGLLNQMSVWIRLEPASNRIRSHVGTNSSFNQVNTTAAYNDGYWHHFALTASGGNTTRVYIDGQLNATQTATYSTGTTTNFTRLGCREDLTQFFDGRMDNLRIWDRELSAGEITNIYQLPGITLASQHDTVCAGASLQLPFTVNGGSGNFQPANIFYAQLSDIQGRFIYPLIIGSVAGTGSGTISAQLPAGLATGNYLIRIIASDYPLVSLNTDTIRVNNADAVPGYNIVSNVIIDYPFDSTATDYSGNGFHGTIVSGITPDTGHTGVPGTALRFNGTNSKITLGNVYPVNYLNGTTDPFSISVWLYQRNTPSQFGYVFSCWDGNIPDGLWFGTTSGGKIRGRINNNSHLEAPFPNLEWVHVVMAYTGTQLRLYVNGVQSGGVLTTSGSIQIPANPHLGWDVISNIGYYRGSMDDFRFYNRALTAEEAGILYRDGSLINSNSPLCSGTLQFDAPAYTGLIYDWDGVAGFSSSLEDPVIVPFNAFVHTGNYHLQMTLHGCDGTLQQHEVESMIHAVTQVTGATVCSGDTAIVSAQGAVGLQDFYWYSDSAGSNLLSFGDSAISYVATVTDTVYVALSDGLSCFSALTPVPIVVTPVPGIPVSINGNDTICAGSSQVYDINPVPGASTYLWGIPAGWTGNSSTTSASVTAGALGGQITVSAGNSCGNSSVQTLQVTVESSPVLVGIISGNDSVCSGSSNTYDIFGVDGADGYNWSLPSGWSGSSNDTSIMVVAGTTGGNLTVSAYNNCGTSSPVNLPVGIFTVNTGVTDAGAVLTANAAGAVYQWIDCLNGNMPIVGETGQSFTAQSNGQYAVIVEENGCIDTSQCFTVLTVRQTGAAPSVHFRVQPNPTSGWITITSFTPLKVHIYSLTGGYCGQWNIQNQTSIDISELEAGIYYLEAEGYTERFKLVKL